MKEIKFQLVLGNKILPARRIEWRNGKPYRADPYPPHESKWFYLNTKLGYILREFTNRKDKHDTPIFEGDILSVHSELWDADVPNKVRVVSDMQKDYGWLSSEILTFKIIGNVYENPEFVIPPGGSHE